MLSRGCGKTSVFLIRPTWPQGMKKNDRTNRKSHVLFINIFFFCLMADTWRENLFTSMKDKLRVCWFPRQKEGIVSNLQAIHCVWWAKVICGFVCCILTWLNVLSLLISCWGLMMLNERASKNKTCLHARLKDLKKEPEYLLLDRNEIRAA